MDRGAERDTLKGRLLLASPLLDEPTFRRTVILILDHNSDGAVGLILNRPSDHPVADHLPRWETLVTEPGLVHVGGPVEPDVGTALARTGPIAILPGVCLVDLQEEPPDLVGAVRIYSGYAGWGVDQLEFELAEGAWYVVDASPDDPFADPHDQWRKVLRRQPGGLAMVADFPDDPGMN